MFGVIQKELYIYHVDIKKRNMKRLALKSHLTFDHTYNLTGVYDVLGEFEDKTVIQDPYSKETFVIITKDI